MPDKYGFNLPWEGRVECTEAGCDFTLPAHADERERRRHHQEHERPREREREQHQRRVQRDATARLRRVNQLRQEGRAA